MSLAPRLNSSRISIELYLRFNGPALLDLVEARRTIETEIAELAATRATEEDCQRIVECLAAMEAVVNIPDFYVNADVRFHAELARAAKNPVLELLLESIRGAMRENIRVVVLSHPTAVEEAMGFHRRIAQAIMSHSPESARIAMCEHLESVGRQLQRRSDEGAGQSHGNGQRRGEVKGNGIDSLAHA